MQRIGELFKTASRRYENHLEGNFLRQAPGGVFQEIADVNRPRAVCREHDPVRAVSSSPILVDLLNKGGASRQWRGKRRLDGILHRLPDTPADSVQKERPQHFFERGQVQPVIGAGVKAFSDLSRGLKRFLAEKYRSRPICCLRCRVIHSRIYGGQFDNLMSAPSHRARKSMPS
jgi:hypothetical protein